uniref:Uncharacterized protein n=1 Tax=Laticauda laticaudata TaxID=8630 RepID=A0A8C5SCC0_LATLA
MGSRQQFVQSSTFKDPERASLRDSGHGDSDQADSDQDTNKGSCCDMSVREALKMKTTSTKSQPLEQGFSPWTEHLLSHSHGAPNENSCQLLVLTPPKKFYPVQVGYP